MASLRKTVVCQQCLGEDDESIDLIKVACHDKLNHRSSPRIRVYWDGLRRRLQQVPSGRDPIRPFPTNWVDRGRLFSLCRGSDSCYGDGCYFAHSFEELYSWNNQLSLTSVPKGPPPQKEYTGSSDDHPHLPGSVTSAGNASHWAPATQRDVNLPGSVPSAGNASHWAPATQRDVQSESIQDTSAREGEPEYVQSRRAQRMKQAATQDVPYQPPRPPAVHTIPQPSTEGSRTLPQPSTEDASTNWRTHTWEDGRADLLNYQGSSVPFEQPFMGPTSWTSLASSQAPVQVPRSTQPVSVMDWPSTDTQSTSTGSGLAEMLALMNTASKETTYWGYKDKFLALLDLEQKEHDHILTTRCNGQYVLVLSPVGQELEIYQTGNDRESDYERYGHILGLNGDQILYCTQASSGLTVMGGIEGTVLSANMFHTEAKLYIAFDKKNARRLKFELCAPDEAWDMSVDVKFKLKYSYFDALRDSVKCIQPDVLRKISPQPGDFRNFVKGHYSAPVMHLVRDCSNDQKEALEAILSSPSSKSPPVLITGAFGTGKTHLLAVAACCLLEQGKETGRPVRIFAASHHQKSPDTFLEHFYDLQESGEMRHDWISVIRMQKHNRGWSHRAHSNIPDHVYRTVDEFRRDVRGLKNQRLFMLAGTYGNALQLTRNKLLPWFFTHILIDEGAQSREPEALSPLGLANEDTKIVIAGDQHQVGPRTLVLGEQPQQYGLAVSLLQRLHDLYRRSDFVPFTTQYSCTLTTNYRCHPDILKLLGELFYDVPLTCHRPPPLHPLAKSSFVFVCTSVDDKAECVDPDQPFEGEARALLEEAVKYLDNWPPSWGSRSLEQVCLMCSTRNQLTVVQELVRDYPKARQIKRLPIYDMQGEEFRACFISTTEPTWKDGSSRNPTKGICDPYVFNTALTRAQSLVVAMGNPFLLLKMERHMVQKYPRIGKGWSTYIRECLARGVLSFSPLLKLNAAQHTLYLKKLRGLTGLSPMPPPEADLSLSWEQPTIRAVPVGQQMRMNNVGPRSTLTPPPRHLPSEEGWTADYYARPREVVGIKLPKQIVDNGYQENASSQLPWKKYTPPLDIKGPGVSRLEKDFKIVDKLGEGEMSVVYRIQNRENLKESAIKIMALPRKTNDIEKTMADIKLVSRLHHEALLQYYKTWNEEAPTGWKEYNLWSPLKPCEEASIVPYATLFPYSPEAHTSVMKGGGVQPDEPSAEDTRSIFEGPATTLHQSFLYIQLELCTEGTLRDWLLTGEGGEQRGVDIFDQVLEVVAFIHEKGFVHRNLKPSNIYLFKNSKIKVGDFGFVTNELKYKPASIMSYYRSPELLHGEACTQKADIFSLGMILFELIYAPPPHDQGKTLTQLQNNLKFPPGFELEHVHESNLIRSMIARDPIERPSASAIKDDEQLKKIRKSAKKLSKKSGKK